MSRGEIFKNLKKRKNTPKSNNVEREYELIKLDMVAYIYNPRIWLREQRSKSSRSSKPCRKFKVSLNYAKCVRNKQNIRQAWWFRPITPGFKRPRQKLGGGHTHL